MKRFESILCVVETGELGKSALERAVTLAESHQTRLTVIDVIQGVSAARARMQDGGAISGNLQGAMVRQREARIVSLLEPYRQRLDVEHRVLMGTPFLEVIREVLRNGHDLVIKCPESPNWLDRLFSGDDMHLLRKCPCPIWFVKPQAPATYRRILAAVDVDDVYPPRELETRQRLNVQILEMAASLAISESAGLHVVHTWESISELASDLVFSSGIAREALHNDIEQERRQQQHLLDACISDLKITSTADRDALDYLQPQIHLLKGAARKEIPALAKRLAVDCIVMGTVARTGIPGLIIGNTAETIPEQIDCSVLAIKPPGFVTPVTLDG
ncbi:MAG TPA: universal stress protein [Rhodothermales bacterium]|nr:universal stress protein [Rhodothermales bacterium]